MSGYDTYNDSHAGGPVLLGITKDTCGTCSSTNVPLYDLSCHNTDDFYCRDCLTKMWNAADDEVTRCPACHNDCGFMPLQDIQDFAGISHDFLEFEAFDKIREQPEVMNNLIAFTADEAVMFLQVTYDYYADQLLDPTELGGMPSHISDSAQKSFAANAYYRALYNDVITVSKMMTTPFDLEEDLLETLRLATIVDTLHKYGNQLDASGVDLDDNDAVLWQATHTFEDINTIRENWAGIIKMWVDLLAWRHLERTASVEGGAAERLREPFSFNGMM
jgi:hypothetical protein